MRASFERGDPASPRGHAIVYFREALSPDRVRACYVVVSPIEMDFAKYVPPMFAAQLAGLASSGPAAIPLPPIPEEVESLDWIERIAEARADDLLNGGSLDPSNPQSMMLATTDVAAEYAQLWSEYAARLTTAPSPAAAEEPALTAGSGVDDLLLSVMDDAEKVGRLARLAGTLRYAVEGQDSRLADETASQIERVGKHLDEAYRLVPILAAARRPDGTGARLLQLYLERAYRLAEGESAAVERLDREIEAIDRPAETSGS